MPGQLRTKPLSIAAVGLTVDGREITEKDIDDIVSLYNPTMYGARINLDHEFNWSGWAAKNLANVDVPGMLGDVLSVKKGKNSEGVTCLYAVLAPNASFVQLNQADQAVYFSIEITRNWQGKEQTYLTGLAVTDYPASLYTDRINFSKSDSDKDVTLLSAVTVELGLTPQAEEPKPGFLKNLFTPKQDDEMKPEQLAAALQESLGGPISQFTTALQENTAAVNKMMETHSGGHNGDSPKGDGDNKPDVSDDSTFNAAQQKVLDGFSQQVKGIEQKFDVFAKKLDAALGEEHDSTTKLDEEQDGDGNDEFKVGEPMV
ncbi:GPO family capsid scaffolding protein [Pseudoalteromonas ruthenica]|mgnify:CR=1 FL=1|uniref:GPO family capsid scaffolding protein n=1 Tax=Pseudoalteromonas ruthenica TaxID=151081 RepID=UPI00110AAD83|nr:GPO family capsid scaffolding protein [Pseudoalteromonas ruthenica]TMO97555.1 phage capsid protein [Pseudoalteromonas ruthenica]